MFDIVNVATTPINIGSFDQCFWNGILPSNMEIYTKTGTWNGSQQTPAAWTLVGSITNFAHGSGTLDPLPIAVNVTIPPGGTQGFYITGDNNTVVASTIGINQLGTVIASNSDLQIRAGVSLLYPFLATFGLPADGRLWIGRVHYCPVGGTVLATNTTTGAGCISAGDVSSYQYFATAPAFDLANNGISLIHTGSGYVATPLTTAYVTPSAGAQVLPLFDDWQAPVTLSQAMPVGRASSTNTLMVCSNGFISAGSGNGVPYTPNPMTFLNGPRVWWSVAWHDYNPQAVGGGVVKFEQVAGVAYITWDGVWDAGGGWVGNANTFQAQFDVTTGSVHYVYQTMSPYGNGFLVGFSDAGASADTGSMDISAALPATYSAATFATFPLAVEATSRPVTGTNWNLNVTQVQPTGVFGVDVFALSDPAIQDLGFVGAPGCGLRASLDVLDVWLVAGNSHAYSFALPNSPALVNMHLYTTSALFQSPPVNAFGAITANGVDARIGDF